MKNVYNHINDWKAFMRDVWTLARAIAHGSTKGSKRCLSQAMLEMFASIRESYYFEDVFFDGGLV